MFQLVSFNDTYIGSFFLPFRFVCENINNFYTDLLFSDTVTAFKKKFPTMSWVIGCQLCIYIDIEL